DGRNAEQRAFQRARDCPGIGDVVAEVPSFINTGHDEVRKAFQHLRDRDVDAVGRRAVDGEHALADVLYTQRMTERERVADRARLLDGRDDGDVADAFQPDGQSHQAFRSVSVVVRDQDSWHVITLSRPAATGSARESFPYR